MTRGSVDIVIASRNRSHKLNTTLASICRAVDQSEVPVQVIVVDNNSIDSTANVINKWSRHLNILSLFEGKLGKNAALNKAIAHISSELVVFTDDDVIVDNQWVNALCRSMWQWEEVSVFGGRVEVAFPLGTPEWIKSPRFRFRSYAFAAYSPSLDSGPADIIPVGPNYAIRRTAIKKVRFDETVGPQGKSYRMGSETELLWRLKDRGHLFAYVPGAVVTHQIDSHQVQVDHLLQRAFNAGRGYEVLGLQGRLPGRGYKPLTLRKAHRKRAFYRLMWVLCGWVSDAVSFRWRSKVRFYDGRIHEKRLGAGAPEDDAVSRPDPSAHTQ